ncbi:retrovirus-related pol polyprotein from transposon tnt 1-94 [Nicotiana attenuata]|uniref:Retrovirus-related pol polyprotein from transposon tnt 1-94 n=1 Tax=Nicotiana attenuata TaxID=49451 RepID=A0A314KTS2_NICAT|nr:retrovirus-related pol polyprotein from transposon tnt 1-94 [Nicotiana attenuata]
MLESMYKSDYNLSARNICRISFSISFYVSTSSQLLSNVFDFRSPSTLSSSTDFTTNSHIPYAPPTLSRAAHTSHSNPTILSQTTATIIPNNSPVLSQSLSQDPVNNYNSPASSQSSSDKQISPSSLSLYPSNLPQDSNINSTPSQVQNSSHESSLSPTSSSQPTTSILANSNRPHHMITRSLTGSLKPRILPSLAASTTSSLTEPHTFAQAIKHTYWQRAMSNKYTTLLQNHTWTLVPPPPQANIVGSKWIFRIKYKPNGYVDRFKARLVAQGFSQQPGLDYTQTFALLIKLSTVRLVISLALQIIGVCINLMCLMAFYMSPRAWFKRLATYLLDIGFKQSSPDHSMFVFKSNDAIMILLIYVDDIAVFGSSKSLIDQFIFSMRSEFSMKDLGHLHYFLGVELVSNSDGILLLQRKYINDILLRFDLANSKHVSTPLHSKQDWNSTSSSLLSDPSIYQQMVGCLQYLAFTGSDIHFAVNLASQFLHQPRQSHLQAVKRIYRYLKGTSQLGLQLHRKSSLVLTIYSDSDWAGCTATRRSTTGFCILLGDNLISWSAKKQPTVARSSTEAEYRALAVAAAEATWLQYLLRDLGVFLASPIMAKCDNIGAIHLAHNPVFHSRAKHVALEYLFIREKMAQGDLLVSHVNTSCQLADLFTKVLSSSRFAQLIFNLHVRPFPSD